MLEKSIMVAGFFLGLNACKHSHGDRRSDINPRVAIELGEVPNSLEASGKALESGDFIANPRVSIDLDTPVIPVMDLWMTNGVNLTVHQWDSLWACKEVANEPTSSCKYESNYSYDRATRKIMANTCECGTELKREATLSTAQGNDLDQLVKTLKMHADPKTNCTEDGMYQELIIKSKDAVEQSFPVANGTCIDHTQSLEQLSFHKLFMWLKNTVP